MAYYPPEFVDRIRTIKRLQEERFMPLRLIREVLEQADRPRTPRKEVLERYELPGQRARPAGRDRRAEPARTGYDADDVKIIEAIVHFRAGGYDEALGFTVYDTLRYRDALRRWSRRRSASCSSASAARTPRRWSTSSAPGASRCAS